MIVIQLARMSGFSPIITVASKRHEPLLKSLGATHVIDRHIPLLDLPRQVKEIAKQPLKYVYDAVSEPETQNIAYDILAPGGHLTIVVTDAVEKTKRTLDKHVSMVFANVQDPTIRDLAVGLYKALPALLESGEIKVCFGSFHIAST